jgi:hypothetical protein
MANKTTHGSSNNRMGFIIIVDHKKNAKVERTCGEGSKISSFGLGEL